MRQTKYALGVDVGTTGIKAGVINLKTFGMESLASNQLGNSSTIKSELLWLKVKKTIRDAVHSFDNKEAIIGIGIAGQMHGSVLYDANRNVINPIFTWRDRKRCDQKILDKVKMIVREKGYDDLGTAMAPGYTGTILLWIKANDPALYRRIDQFSLITDFIRSRLMGKMEPHTDPTNAFGTGLFDVRAGVWHKGLIQHLDLDPDLFPEVRASSRMAGYLSKENAKELGLNEIPIIYGGGDNQIGMLGSGLVDHNSPILINIGTAAQISRVIPTYMRLPDMDTRSFFDDQFALVGASLGGGGSYEWLRNQINSGRKRKIDYAQLDQAASQVPPGADGLMFCTGPSREFPNRKKGFYGNLDKINSTGHKARAVMEGVLMDLYDHYSTMKDIFPRPFLIGAGKGLQKSEVWCGIAAEIFDMPVKIFNFENVVCGAAILAAVGSGYLSDYGKAVEKISYRIIKPNRERAEMYSKGLIKDYPYFTKARN